ncbi:MAG: hypothetical protein AUH30_18705 [Candidatus Rokubacteria bacterium 13_1_40CM_68_15]|nr:MAG: hypothetical protein AUH30_18705 [Candidatus Rokubacteria bacterium 13_1_40CM_68_15]
MRGQFAREAVTGKAVLIGATAPRLRDVARTPVDLYMPGVELIANSVETLLAGRPPEHFTTLHGLLVVAASVSAAALAARLRGVFWSTTIVMLGGLALTAVGLAAPGIAMSLVAVPIAWLGGFAAAHVAPRVWAGRVPRHSPRHIRGRALSAGPYRRLLKVCENREGRLSRPAGTPVSPRQPPAGFQEAATPKS